MFLDSSPFCHVYDFQNRINTVILSSSTFSDSLSTETLHRALVLFSLVKHEASANPPFTSTLTHAFAQHALEQLLRSAAAECTFSSIEQAGSLLSVTHEILTPVWRAEMSMAYELSTNTMSNINVGRSPSSAEEQEKARKAS
jgi:hypothetical protein